MSHNFFKWWWARRDSPEKGAIIFGIHAFISLLTLPFLGIGTVLYFLGGIALIVLSFLIYTIVGSIREQVKLFKEEKEQEAKKILMKLKGQSVYDGPMTEDTVNQSKDRVQQILDALRASKAAGRP